MGGKQRPPQERIGIHIEKIKKDIGILRTQMENQLLDYIKAGEQVDAKTLIIKERTTDVFVALDLVERYVCDVLSGTLMTPQGEGSNGQ